MVQIGNYKILKQIGEGGFGRVFVGEHIYLNTYACLKQNKVLSKEYVSVLHDEARLLWKLDDYHSIPSIKDFFEIEKNNAVQIMSLIEGKTLEDIITKNGRIHQEDACWIIERLLGALYYCHYNGVIHSDVKPANVFVEPKKRDIKLIDFGLSSYRPDSSTIPVGYTPLYAAPELSMSKPPIPETDIYGAGLVMLYALGGNVSKKSFPDDINKDIIDYCTKMIAYDPAKRPNWDKENLVQNISDLRQDVFGRRHIK
jgi:serine/threonine protein kinase